MTGINEVAKEIHEKTPAPTAGGTKNAAFRRF